MELNLLSPFRTGRRRWGKGKGDALAELLAHGCRKEAKRLFGGG